MTYTWEILSLKTQNTVNSSGESLTDAVLTINWRRHADNGAGNKVSITGQCLLSSESVSLADFIAFESLTEAKVVEWLESKLGAELIADYDSSLEKKLNQDIATDRSVPWL